MRVFKNEGGPSNVTFFTYMHEFCFSIGEYKAMAGRNFINQSLNMTVFSNGTNISKMLYVR
jgi:hypothetical protein